MALSIPIISEFQGGGVDKAIKQFQQLDGVGAKTGFALKKAFLPATAALGALTAGIGLATKAAMEDEAAQLELARQLRTTTQATDAQIKAVEQSISAFSKQTAMADDQLRPALANLVRATGSLELSQKAMSVTADLATAKNIDMETASVAVSKALAGQTAALIKLDPSLKGVIDSSSSADEIMQALNGSVGGAAETFANSAEGGLKNFGIQMDELKESIGAAFIPVMEKLLPYVLDFTTFLQDNTKELLIVIGAIAAMTATIVAANVAMKAYNAFQIIVTAANAVLATSFTSVSLSAGTLTKGLGIVMITLAALYELYREGPRAIAEFMLPFKQFAVGVYNSVKVVANGINQIINAAIIGLNQLINALNVIPGVSIDLIPLVPMLEYTALPTLDAITSGASGRGGAAREGGTGSFPSGPLGMAEAALITAPSVGGGGGSGGKASSVLDLSKNYAGNMGGNYGITGNAGDFSSLFDQFMVERGTPITVNVNGGLATSADIGRAVVNSIKAMNRVDGPAQIQVA
jgi:hypothetical protein